MPESISAAERDDHFMSIAVTIASRNVGRTGPNPSVGCVLTQDDGSNARIIGRAVTAFGGRPHAETIALANAVEPPKGATAYVTLEPCAHHGKTGPCAEALIDAQVSRVVVALEDPNPRVSGQGIAALEKAGITVRVGVASEEAREVIAGFLTRIEKKRPLVTLKVATSLDGRIATHNGASQWITNSTARRRGQMLRATHDAIMVGSTTALVDDPQLTCRIKGLHQHTAIRVIADGRLRLPLTSKLVRSARDIPTWLFTLENGDQARSKAFADCGVDILAVPPAENGLMSMPKILEILGERGVNALLVEGGAQLASSLLQDQLVDRLVWFRAPSVIGGDGTGAVAPLGIDHPSGAPHFHLMDSLRLGDNVMDMFEKGI